MVMSYFISFIRSYPKKFFKLNIIVKHGLVVFKKLYDDERRPLTTILGYLSDSGYIKTQKTSRLFITVLHKGEL